MQPSEFIAAVEQSIESGRVPRPALRTKLGPFTPVLAPLLARRRACSVPADNDGLALARVLESVAQGTITGHRELLAALKDIQSPRLRQFPASLFHLLYGNLELVAHEMKCGERIFVEDTAADLFEVVSGYARAIAEARGGDLASHVAHFRVHAACFLESDSETGWSEYAERVQARLAMWGEDPAPDEFISHAARNLLLSITDAPNGDAAYDAIRNGRRALHGGALREDVHRGWLSQLGWRTADRLLRLLAPGERRPFYQSVLREVIAKPPESRPAVAAHLGLVDSAGETLLGDTRYHGPPRFTFPGGSTIGRSCALYEGFGALLAFDMGGDTYGRVPAWSPRLEQIDALFVTHAHHDHIGGLFHLYGTLGYDGPWFAHPTTIACANLALDDSLKLRGGESGISGEMNRHVLEQINSRARAVLPGSPTTVNGVRVTGYDAGHVRGSLQFLVEAAAGDRVHRTLISGDINPSPTLSVAPLEYPSESICLTLDVLIVEGTNALRPEEIVDGLAGGAALRAQIQAQNRWPVLVPVMSLGRAQEVIAALADTPWKVGVLGLAARMTEATEMIVPRNVTLENDPAARVARGQYDVLVASAGCLQGGPSRYFWEETGWSVPVILTGYLFPGTPAHAHANEWPRIRFSGHGSSEDWAAYAARFPRAKKYLIHFPGDRARAQAAGFVVPRVDTVYGG